MIGARGQVLAAYATANGQQVKVLHRWPASAQPGPLVGDPAGGYALLSIASAPGRKKLTPHVTIEQVERDVAAAKEMTR